MEVGAITEAVCKMAKDFGERDNVSMIALLEESGYLENADQITEARILEYLQHHPGLVTTWVLQSENKRTDSGWYIRAPHDSDIHQDAWVVGFYPAGETREFRDGASACAFYVKQEIEKIRGNTKRAR